MARSAYEFAGAVIQPGSRATVNLPLPGLYTDPEVEMPVHVIHGRRSGPVIVVSAAVHGDEINGVEIIRRLLLQPQLRRLRGTLLAVPIVNVYGFHYRSRYLPDRRDLNRSFPGSVKGSMASRLAYIFLNDVVRHADLGIDLHTAAIHRDNLPQIRADMKTDEVRQLAKAFAAPAAIHSAAPPGSLRNAAAEIDTPILVYEAGEALRFDEVSIRIGLRGIMNVMREIGMITLKRKTPKPSAILRSSTWVRAPYSGVVRTMAKLGDIVAKGDVLGIVSSPVSDEEYEMMAPCDGIIIGRANLPLTYEGEAIFHIGRTRQTSLIEHHLDAMQDTEELSFPELVEEPEIV